MTEREAFEQAFIERDLRQQRRRRGLVSDVVTGGFLAIGLAVLLAAIGAHDALVTVIVAGALGWATWAVVRG